MAKVLIMMSTYNGEKYLSEQLDSIIANRTENIEISLMIRDDGSTDSTREIINAYKERLDIQFCEGENLRPAQSYRKLIELVPLGYDAYADQDDIWLDNMISSAVEELDSHSEEVALWYCGLVAFQNEKTVRNWVCPKE